METKLSPRLLEIVNALPLKEGLRILEIGCGPGAMAREMARRIGNGHILAIDRSGKAIQQAVKNLSNTTQNIAFRQVAIEDFELESDDLPFDLAVAIRVGALDGRHPEKETISLQKIAKALRKEGKLYINGGNPLKEISLDQYR